MSNTTKTKIAIPLAEGKLCMHFGHCEKFAIIEVDGNCIQRQHCTVNIGFGEIAEFFKGQFAIFYAILIILKIMVYIIAYFFRKF